MNRTLRVWLIITSREHDVLKFLNKRFSQFEEQHNINIELKLITWNRAFETLIEAYKNNNSPDIIQIGTTWVRTLAYMGYIEKIPQDFETRTSFVENMNQICIYRGDQYAVPWNVDTIVLATRTDYLKTLGIKKRDLDSWEKFYQVCETITEKRRSDPDLPEALAFSLRAEADLLHRFAAILWSKGGEFADFYQIPEKILTEEKVMENISYLADLMQTSDIKASDLDKHPYQLNNEFYRQGSYVFYIGSWYGIIEDISHNSFESENGNYNYTILPFPSADGTKSQTYGGGSVLAVSSRSEHKQKAWKLIELFLQDDFINEWIRVTGKVPAFEVDFWQKRDVDQRINTMYQQSINSKTYPAHPAWATIEKILSTAVAHSIWELIDNNNTEINEETFKLLKKADQNIRDLLKLSWEMKNYE
ncbi:ABC-type glycerol-3-phosphate transport system substrate-binding protein [Halanaerobium saccharolyticum]|uniref:ABC-type glycerol-3-phosphate transport system substrate-binding protein n=1 Tax=Halanaerobium saccharolyticum TaxID=43595 RepID=A0A4R6M1Y4_9FIRM|nr:extracellular solute-binding protein [Halanaerobium saccharolyticum]TDO95241.1 ABC-type glycerol-3-phosphate transport system substrate-binding protein [Halanaerobium saccharolyticum]